MSANTPLHKKTIKCPFCPCLFFTPRDLAKHYFAFGEGTAHSEKYRKTHEALERYGGNE